MKIKLADRVNEVQEYYFSAKLRQIAEMRASGIDVINLGVGNPDLKPAPAVVKRLCREVQNDDSHGYQSYVGIPELRAAMADWYHRKFGVDLDPASEILPLIGSKEGIMHLSMTYLQAGDQVLVPDPGYPSYRSASSLAGAEVKPYGLTADTSWLPNLDQIEGQDLSRVKMMWLNYPHMPTGTVASYNLFDKLVKFAHNHNILLCHDNPYAFILNDNPRSILAVDGAKEVAVELNSLSKTFNMAGWRIGLLTAAADRVKEVLRFKSNMDSGMFRPLQLAAIEALHQSDDWYQEVNSIYSKRRSLAEEIMSSIGCTFDTAQVGMFLWGQIPSTFEDGYDLVDRVLTEARVFITPGNIFGQNGRNYVRISLCNKSEILMESLERILEMTQNTPSWG